MKKIVGHNTKLDYLDRVIKGDETSHAYCFYGPSRIGKTTVGIAFSKAILCCGDKDGLNPCNECQNCRLFDANNLPDFYLNDTGEAIGVEEIRELVHFLELKPYQSKIKVALISHAERMSVQSANAFLKSLEEPPINTLIILTTDNLDNLLPTIISRTQLIKFGALTDQEVYDYLSDTLELEKEKADQISQYCNGKLGLAIAMVEDENLFSSSKDFFADFISALDNDSYVAKIQAGEKFSQNSDLAEKYLDTLESNLHRQLYRLDNNAEGLKIVGLLDKIAKSREYLLKNVNPRLVWESILFTKGSNDKSYRC